jgi:hypothetical protein
VALTRPSVHSNRQYGNAGYGQDRQTSSWTGNLGLIFIVGIVLWVGYSMFTR